MCRTLIASSADWRRPSGFVHLTQLHRYPTAILHLLLSLPLIVPQEGAYALRDSDRLIDVSVLGSRTLDGLFRLLIPLIREELPPLHLSIPFYSTLSIMSLLVDDSAAQWVFSSTENANLSMRDAGWHQLAHDPSAITSGYYNSTALWTTTPGATASLIFQGTEIFLYSAKSPQFGTMNVTCDWNSTSVPLTQAELQPGEMVWHFTGLDPTVLHAVRVQSLGDGRINIDKVGIEPGLPSAIPPSTPTPLPPAFPNIRIPTTPSIVTSMTTLKTTVTMTMTMTASASAKPSSGVSLSNGALTGIILASVTSSVILGLLLLCWKRRRSQRKARRTVPGLQRSAFHSLHLPYWLRRTTSSNISRSDSSFIAIEDQEKAEEGLVGDKEDVPGKQSTAILPSIRRLSTLTIGRVPYSSSPVPSRTTRTHAPASPTHPAVSWQPVHRRDQSLAVSLSINTDTGSVRKNAYSNTTLNRRGTVRSVRTHHRSFSGGFSVSDLTEEWEEIDFSDDHGKDPGDADDAHYYAQHFSSQSGHADSDDRHWAQENTFTDDQDDVSPDTPLLPASPAVASSNVSLSHYSTTLSHNSRLSKGNRILRSLRSRSSRKSSLRQSSGKLSRHNSVARTSEMRTPVSKYSSCTTASDSPRSERHPKRISALAGPGVSNVMPDSPLYVLPSGVPPVPIVPGSGQLSPPFAPPSSWDTSRLTSARKVYEKPPRIHRPAGPRARSSSNASTSSRASSAKDSIHSRESSPSENTGLLSVVEEGSGLVSSRTSMDRV